MSATELVRELAHGRWRAQVLDVTLRLGIPELLDAGECRAGEIASRLGADEDGIARLLQLLVALGLVAEEDGRFRGTEASRLLLATHPRTQRRDALHTLSPSTRLAWDALEHSVRSGGCGFEAATGVSLSGHLIAHPDEATVVDAYRGGVARHNAGALLAGHPFPATGTVVVIGAHNEPALAEILRERPGVRGLLASPADGVPRGGDVYVLLHVLHDWPDEEAGRYLRRVGNAMDPGADLVILAAAREARTQPLAAYLDLHALVAFGGRERSVEGYRTLLAAAGLDLRAATLPEQRPGICVLTARLRG
jgi:hypothetical protein